MTITVSRRALLQGAAATGAILTVGFDARGALAAGQAGTVLNPFVRIDGNGLVTVVIKHFEMGQGTTTGLATLAAEELDADWAKVTIDFAPADKAKYANLAMGAQGTGGSTAIANSWLQYREAGAAARELLVRAAAKVWGLPESAVTVTQGRLVAGSKSAHFGAFVAQAATLAAPAKPVLKSPDQFKLIGKADLARQDNRGKTDGSAVFALDVKVKGMVHAAILRSPKFGGTLTGFDAAEARKITGFVEAKALPNRAGVVVYAKSTWAAFKARDAIAAQWDFAKAETRGIDAMTDVMRQQAAAPEFNATKDADRAAIAKAAADAPTRIEAEFFFPFLAHAAMEPLNCVIEPAGKGVRFHDGCQFPGIVQPVIAHVLGLTPELVEIRTVYAGGSFGRRATPSADYQAEAAMAFDLLGRKTPVKLVWSREDDMTGGYYRPAALHKVAIGLDGDGGIAGWDHRIVTKPILKGTPFEAVAVHDGIDHTSVEGIVDTPYPLPRMAVGVSDFKTPVPILWWRSVGHTHTAFVMESLLDMIAAKRGLDPVQYRLDLLASGAPDPRRARLAGVIKVARDLAGWGGAVPAGRARGFAAHVSFNSYVATVAEITVTGGTQVHVDKLCVAVDCGVAVNPDVIKAQMEGGSGFGLSAILRNEITFDQGVVVQRNFGEYETLRIGEMPEVQVVIVPSAEAPTGVGEPGVPPVGPAVANALFAATAKRVTALPLSKAGFTFA